VQKKYAEKRKAADEDICSVEFEGKMQNVFTNCYVVCAALTFSNPKSRICQCNV